MIYHYPVPENPDREYLLSIHRLLSSRIDQLRQIDLQDPNLQIILRQFEELTEQTVRLIEDIAIRLASD